MTWWKWSKTAANNAGADSTCPWPEGMAPSQINDSARGNMAALAKYFGDVSGALVTTGTSTGYSVSSNGGFDTLANMNGAMIAFTPHVTSGATVTLNVDGLGAKPLRLAPGVELIEGQLVQGTPYVAVYNNTDGVWYLRGLAGNPYNIPLGGGMVYFGTSAPNSAFAFPFGQAVSRTIYAPLFALFGTTYGAGDGSTTFNLPDLRGRVPVGLDNMGGTTANRLSDANSTIAGVRHTLGGAGGQVTHALSVAELAAHTHANTLTDPGHAHSVPNATGFRGGSNTTTGVGSGVTYGDTLPTTTSGTAITINNASAGSGATHENMQPSLMVNYIMRIV
jgi:microcystin-dependent protein